MSGCAALDRRGYESSFGELSGRFSAQPLPPLGHENGAGIDERWIAEFIAEFVKNDAGNSMEDKFPGEKIYQDALVGFSAGPDPLFLEYKKIIGPFHLTPDEAMAMAAGTQGLKAPPAEQIGVVSFILPFADPIVASNASEKRWCSSRWAQARLLGGLFTRKVQMALITELARYGILAAAPDMMPQFKTSRNTAVGYASNWSFRHLAFAAGLGSFGMSDLFISEKGTAHRSGAVAVALPLKPNRDRAPHYRHHCLQHHFGGCLICSQRCPVGAISEKGHDKNKCGQNVVSSWPRNQAKYRINIYGCGLCSSDTPCSQESPIQFFMGGKI
ncbi:MAG TPA: epoxyqueuosine reductase [bacterium]|nr:epoxyqueuosine reductase [bacterium]